MKLTAGGFDVEEQLVMKDQTAAAGLDQNQISHHGRWARGKEHRRVREFWFKGQLYTSVIIRLFMSSLNRTFFSLLFLDGIYAPIFQLILYLQILASSHNFESS